MQKVELRRQDLIEPELSYSIIGAIFAVYNELGPGLKEYAYQKALAKVFGELGIAYKEQVRCPIKFRGENIGSRFLDFLVDNKVIVELKCGDNLPRTHILQVKEYLVLTNLKLAILATLTSNGVKFRRIVNIN